EGTTDATLYAFGMHLNPEHRGSAAEALRIAAAFAFAERWLRAEVPPDNARRVTPFVDPYGEGYIRELGAAFDGRAPDLSTFIALYGRHNPDRNRGLDLWPLLAHLDPEAAEAAHRGPISGARPAFHYRLPDSLVSRPGWSPAAELDRWEIIEAAAADPARFDALRLAALAHRAWLPGQSAYENAVAGILT
ncbi:MAG: amidoligase family protein, partial [Pseudomonadota bacterium]